MAVTGRTPLLAGNWKMNLDHLQAVAFVQKLHWTLKDAKHENGSVEVAVFPPFTDIRTVQTLLDADKIPFALGAQDLSTKDSGAYTGEISGAFLAKLDVRYVIIGHSERREYHAETDDVIAAKVQAALRHKLVPVICVGETRTTSRSSGRVRCRWVSCRSPSTACRAMPTSSWPTSRSGRSDPARRRRPSRRRTCAPSSATSSPTSSGRMPPSAPVCSTAGRSSHPISPSYMREPDVDGALIGGASLVVDEFAAIIRYQKHVGV